MQFDIAALEQETKGARAEGKPDTKQSRGGGRLSAMNVLRYKHLPVCNLYTQSTRKTVLLIVSGEEAASQVELLCQYNRHTIITPHSPFMTCCRKIVRNAAKQAMDYNTYTRM